MDQINTGVLKLKQYAASSHVKGTRIDFGVRREEPIFDALIGQKNDQCRNDVVEDKSSKREYSEKDTAQETVEKTEKPAVGKEDEETCDVAREVAASQIVWIVEPNAEHLKVPGQMENVATIEQPMIISVSDEPTKPIEEILGTQLTELTGEVAEGEQLVEIVQETVIETDVNAQLSEDIEIDAESDETGAEAMVGEMPRFEDVEAAPIKVAEAPERAENSAPVEQQVAVKLSDLLESGESKVQIQLEPVQLGKLTIELTRSADGTLSVLLDAENAQTRSLLERHMGNLQEALADRGQRAVQITVEHNEESQRQDNQQRDDFYDGRNGQNSQQEQRRNEQRGGADFMQQLRLGLIPLEDEEEE